MTRRSSGIRAAWHFWYAVSFSGESGLRKVGLCGTHPLTQRYVFTRQIREFYGCRDQSQQMLCRKFARLAPTGTEYRCDSSFGTSNAEHLGF
ncbi:TPA: DUF3265 domain-containing protein [Vibrio vulnificus]|nr:DUF3265 domain-containing protein [Vibrio vulnificus]